MTTTSTFNFNPAASNLTLMAFSRIGIRRPEITPQHLVDAETEANLLQVEISSRQPNLWTSSLQSLALTSGTAAYTLPEELIAIQAAYITTTSGGVSTDRIIWPLSAYEYSALPNKTQSAPPQSYWMNKQITPTITLWPVPDDAATYTLKLRAVSQIEDATLINGATLDMPYRFLDVFVAGLAHRMARIYARDQEQLRKIDYAEAWANAAMQDVEDSVSLLVAPNFSGYFR